MSYDQICMGIRFVTEGNRQGRIIERSRKGLSRTTAQKNNLSCHSLMIWDPKSGYHLRINTDEGYQAKKLNPKEHELIAKLRDIAQKMDLKTREEILEAEKPSKEIRYDLPGFAEITVQEFGDFYKKSQEYREQALVQLHGSQTHEGCLVIRHTHRSGMTSFVTPELPPEPEKSKPKTPTKLER